MSENPTILISVDGVAPAFGFRINACHLLGSMLAAGDFDWILARGSTCIWRSLTIARERTRKYFRHDGAHYPETITFWGTEVSAHYGWTPFEERERPEAESPYLEILLDRRPRTDPDNVRILRLHMETNEFARTRLIPNG